MSIVVVIVAVIIILILLLVFTFGFFMGLGRKKKDLKRLEQEQEQQKKTQESILQHFLLEDKKKEENEIFPVKIINRSYKKIKKFIKFKQRLANIKKLDVIWYLRKYLLSYIGIAVLVFGFGYFVKFAINSAYINIAGRFFIAVIISILIIVLSHFLRKKYKTFSSILMGGAIGSLYITFTISFYNYNIFTTLQVFSVFLILTFFSIVLSVVYNRLELLFLAIFAGFFAPIFSGIDYNNFIVILIYILLLDIAGVIITSIYKNILIRVLFSIFTGIYMVLWVYKSYQTQYFEDFETGFFLIFGAYILLVLISLSYNLRYKVKELLPIEFSLTLAINLIYYSVAMYMLNALNPEYKGLFTAFMAVINIIFLISIILRKGSSKGLIYLFGMIILLFITLIPPVQLVGKSITIIWAVETVLLLWFSLKLEIKMLKTVSIFLIFGLIASFVLNVLENYMAISHNAPVKRFLLNQTFISGLMTSLGLGINFIILGKGKKKYLIKPIKMIWFRVFIFIVAIGALYVSVNSEILYRLTRTIKDNNLLNMYMGIFNFAFILVLLIVLVFIKSKIAKIFAGIIAILSFILFFSVYLTEIIKVREHMLTNLSVSINQFISHTILITFVLFILFFGYINIRQVNDNIKNISKWLFAIFVMAVLTTEIDHLSVVFNNNIGTPVSSIIYNAHYFYYTLFWIMSAFAISFSSMLFKDREMIRIAMFIIILVLLKIFIFDFSNIAVAERTISFISAGFIVLFIAYVRQRLFEKYNDIKHL